MVENHCALGYYKKGKNDFLNLCMALVKLVLECYVWFKYKHCLKVLENKELKRVPCTGTVCTYCKDVHIKDPERSER